MKENTEVTAPEESVSQELIEAQKDLTSYPALQREITSQVILNLPPESRPKNRVICMSCEQGLWITSVQTGAHQIDCYCRVMRVTTYSTFHPRDMLDCDIIHILEAQAKEEDDD